MLKHHPYIYIGSRYVLRLATSHSLWLDPACRASQLQDSSVIERLRTSIDVGATGFWAESVNRTEREAMHATTEL